VEQFDWPQVEHFGWPSGLHRAFYPFRDEKRHPMETPDVLVYGRDYSELRFVECKREDTADKINVVLVS
jgi:hypothetical protein